MKKKSLLSIFIMMVFVLSVFSCGVSAEEISGNWRDFASESLSGKGTAEEPFLIQSAEDLAYISKCTTKTNKYDEASNSYYFKNTFFKITAAELDLSDHYWTPAKFNGYLDGNNCVIKGLTVNVTSKYSMMQLRTGGGLFSELNCAKGGDSTEGLIASVQNLHFENPSINSTVTGTYGGVLAGYVRDVYVSNCTVSGGSVTGFDYSGGLIGHVDPSDDRVDAFVIDSCSSTADISVSTDSSQIFSGGLIGGIHAFNQKNKNIVSILNCWSSGEISVTSSKSTENLYAGGILGFVGYGSYGVELENCFSMCSITGSAKGIGGLVGYAHPSKNNPFSGEVIIRNSAALNDSLASSAEETVDSGRIISTGAAIASEGKGTFANNYALDVMSVKGSYAKDDENANGTGVSKETCAVRSFWETTLDFDFSAEGAWQWDDAAAANGYPTLKKELADRMAITFSLQPRDATQYSKTPATFAVAPSGGALGYTYQWQAKAPAANDWTDVSEGTSATLQISGGYDSGTQFQCVVTDQANQSATSEPATLTVTSSKYTPEDALKELNSYYREKGSVSHAKESFSLLTAETDLSDYTMKLPFWDTYTARIDGLEKTSHRGYFPWSLLDSYAWGTDPHAYLMVDGENTRTINLIEDNFLKRQDPETGKIYNRFTYYPIFEEDLPAVILGLEMYFDGGAWGNEAEGTKLGRDGAIEYFFTVADEAKGVKGALAEHEASRGLELVYSDYIDLHSSEITANIHKQRSVAEAAILAARLVDDPKWGEKAEETLSGLMKTLEYLYDTRKDDSSSSAVLKYTESQARYVSALIAAGNATDNWFKKNAYFNLADEIVKDEILKAKCTDGRYNIIGGEPSVTGDTDATAAVMMALGDYAKQKSILMDYVFDVPDEDAAALDLNKIELPNPVTGDLELPVTGLNGSEITWETSDKSAITTAGKVTRGDEDVTVVLTATATKGEAVATRSFEMVVKAKVSNADEDALDAVLNALYVPMETTHDITLGTSIDDSVTLVWESSNPDVLSAEGNVNRPAGGNDAEVTLKATASKGESLSKSKEFVVKVYAQTDDSLKESYYLIRDKYLATRSIGGYWNVWAAYAALGDYITDPANGYSLSIAPPDSTWYGTQYGASVLALCAMGENPYNYQGKNWVKMLQENFGGPFAGPTFSELGMEAAGADSDYGFTASPAAGITATSVENMTMGIDIAGWAAVILAAHHGEADADAAAAQFIDLMKNTYGVSKSGNFSNPSGSNVNFISSGCGIMGLASLLSVGYTDADVSTWTNETSGKTPVDAVYQEGLIDEIIPGYNNQIAISLSDLYRVKYLGGTSAWISCRVSGEKLAAQEAAANEILADKDAYEAESIKAIEAALAATAEISEERRSANIADYGEEYYALYDAVRYAEKVGQAEKDAEAAAAVTKQLNALDAADDITLSDKDAVEAARAAYDGLTDKQKSLVDKDALDKLTAAEKALAELESGAADQDAAAQVKKAINALPDVKELLASDAEAVKAARAAYDGLNDAQKALVPEKSVAKLEALEARLAELEGKDVADISAMTDVKAEDWFYDDVAYVLGNGLFKGMTETTFGPQEWMTRAQFVTVLGRYAGVEDSSAAYPNQTIFGDVPANAYYASHVKWATDHGVTVGTSATTFSPNANISRQDMSVMMLRFAKAMGISLPEADDAHFADDADIAEYAKEAVYRMKAAGILNGKGDDMFMPKEQSKRCEVAAVLHRFFTQEEDVPSVVLSMEKFTLGQGYVIEPMVIELEEGDTVASVFLRAAEENDIEVNYDESGTFYLRSVKDNDTREAVIPAYILNAVTDAGGEISGRGTENWLGEFDYYTMAGWMFCLNNEKPKNDQMELGAGQAVVKDGDVIRWQFTISGLGADIGLGYKTDNLITAANKDALTAAVAKANSKTKNTDAYKAAVQVLMNLEASQDEVDAALKALK